MLHKVWAYFDAGRAALRHGLAGPLPHLGGRAARPRCASSACRRSRRWSTRTSPAWRAGSPSGSRSSPRTRPGAVPTATLFPEPDVADYLGAAVDGGRPGGEGARAGGRVRPARSAAPPGLGAARRGRRAGDGALRQRSDPRRAHRAGRVRRGAGRATRACRWCWRTPGCPSTAVRSTCSDRFERVHLDTTMVGDAVQRADRTAPARLAGPSRRRRRPRRARHGLPQHPLPVRRTAGGDSRVGGSRRPTRRDVLALRAARRPARLLGTTAPR